MNTCDQVQALSVAEVAAELQRLQSQAAANQLSTADITGGTITVSNIGEGSGAKGRESRGRRRKCGTRGRGRQGEEGPVNRVAITVLSTGEEGGGKLHCLSPLHTSLSLIHSCTAT